MLQAIVVVKIDVMWETASESIPTHIYKHTNKHIFKVASYKEYFIIKSFFHCFLFSQHHPKVGRSKKAK